MRDAQLVVGVLLVVGCRGVDQPVAVPALRLALTEQWSGGGRLILVDERGDRWAVLAAAGEDGPVRDEQPAFSPDGRWLAFVSSRGRGVEHTSLWIMPAAVGATPVRLTDGAGEDLDPTWTPDGTAIVFARRDRDHFALARIAVAATGAGIVPGPIERLAASPVHHLAPAVHADGRIAYQEIDLDGGARSRIALRDPDGSITFVTDGPLDVTPRWTPDGAGLVYATAVVRPGGLRDLDLWQIDVDGAASADGSGAWPRVELSGTDGDARPLLDLPGTDGDARPLLDLPGTDDDARPLLDLPGTDESGPRWSHDGRWLFATSMARDPVVGAELPSVIYVDVAARPPMARMLRDTVGAIPRQGPAPAALPLAADVLAAGPDYRRALDDAFRDRARERERAAAEAAAAGAARPDGGL